MRPLSFVASLAGTVWVVLLFGCSRPEPAPAPVEPTPEGVVNAEGKEEVGPETVVAPEPVTIEPEPVAPEPEPAVVKGYSDILLELIDLDRLPYLEEGVATAQSSSYDRRSRYDPDTDGYVDWGANADSGHYAGIHPETRESLMADIEGPGCIYRIWSANPQGRIRFYLDGDEKPTYEFDFNDIFLGGIEPFREPLVWKREKGNPGSASCSYVPIPFAERCRVTADRPHGQYYHIGYKTFPEDWQVKSFRLPLSDEEQAVLERVCSVWGACGMDPQPRSDLETTERTAEVAPGAEVVLAELKGPAVIHQLFAKLTSKEKWAIRNVLLRIYWDGAETPAVDAPIGDFFGEAFGEEPYASLVMGMRESEDYSFWRMPFRESARIVALNQGKKPGEVAFRALWRQAELPPDTAFFHAKWRRDRESKEFDYPFLRCEGRGLFVGAALFVDNVLGGWWGEGDEKVHVDGEKFPSTFGTGSEDYFGDAWGIRFFVNPLHGCPNSVGRKQSCYRWHTTDAIPFTRSFAVTIENYSALSEGPKNDYSSMAYWYQVPGGTDFFEAHTAEGRAPQADTVPGAIEAEGLFDAPLPQGMEVIDDADLPEPLSGAKGIRVAGKLGERFTFPLPVPADERYILRVGLAQEVPSARYELLVDDKVVRDTVRLRSGIHPIVLGLADPAGGAERCEMIVDYFIIEPVRVFIREWMLIGPFDNTGDEGFDREYPPEKGVDVTRTEKGKGGVDIAWKPIEAGAAGLVDVCEVLADASDIVAYGAAIVESPVEQEVDLFAGSDDGIKIWINGVLVHSSHVHRAYTVDQERARVKLKEGENHILVKIDQGGGPCGFGVRLADPEGLLRYRLPQ